MTKSYVINGRKVSFQEVTAIWHEEPEAGRRDAVLIHDDEDTFHDGDFVVFGVDLPEDKEAAEFLLEECGESDSRTMNTIENK